MNVANMLGHNATRFNNITNSGISHYRNCQISLNTTNWNIDQPHMSNCTKTKSISSSQETLKTMMAYVVGKYTILGNHVINNTFNLYLGKCTNCTTLLHSIIEIYLYVQFLLAMLDRMCIYHLTW